MQSVEMMYGFIICNTSQFISSKWFSIPVHLVIFYTESVEISMKKAHTLKSEEIIVY